MWKAISSAFMLMLMILVLKAFWPDIADLLATIIVKVLTLVNNGLDVAGNQLILE